MYSLAGSHQAEDVESRPTSMMGTTVGILSLQPTNFVSTFDGDEFQLTPQPHPSTSKVISPEMIRPHPKAGPRKRSAVSGCRKRGDTKILTDTPVKRQLEAEAKQRTEKNMKSSRKPQKQLKVRRTNSNQRQKRSSTKSRRSTTSEDSDRCKICKHKFGDTDDPRIGDDWIKCLHCSNWFHDSCAQANGILDDGDEFTCSDCV